MDLLGAGLFGLGPVCLLAAEAFFHGVDDRALFLLLVVLHVLEVVAFLLGFVKEAVLVLLGGLLPL